MVMGSPPHVRGKVSHRVHHKVHDGITPACAGKSWPGYTAPCRSRDHPRVCEEKTKITNIIRRATGSPPRVRGKAGHIYTLRRFARITPAYAGKSPQRAHCSPVPWDHPCVCGEKIEMPYELLLKEGSPPRVRGKVSMGPNNIKRVRITPACAGKRGAAAGWAAWLGDHPRVCGEKFHPASDRKLGRVQGTKRSSGPAPAAAPAGLAGSCPASPPWSYPPCITVSRPRP